MRNILQRQGPAGMIELNFSDFQKLIPTSAMTKFLQNYIFGHTFPKTINGSHFDKPVNPLVTITDPEEWKREILKLYPIEKLRQ
jgi:hypothetical protein